MLRSEHVVVWSHSRNELRLSTMDAEMRRNRNLYRESVADDWCVLVMGDQDVCRAAISAASNTLKSRNDAKK